MQIKLLLGCEIGGVPRYAGDVLSCGDQMSRALISAGIATQLADNHETTEKAVVNNQDKETR